MKTQLHDLIYAAIFAALISALAIISIPLPFTPVPVSGQSLGVMLTGCLLAPRQSALAIITFLLLGAIGLPVFAGFSGGLGIILGPRGGYLFGYLVGAIMISVGKGSGQNFWQLASANLFGGILIVYLIGVPWLSVTTGISLDKALYIGALPFILGDIIKVFIATSLGLTINKRLQKNRIKIS
ncbi:MAG TPA: biotin transporter BioY [Candidatus Avacidaminococcus intestinavium]|uniref:Biotin transporter n=1 Tax=Candidatus Avacidaminococcus intestinavium TaxID=2840684 RepID=A0A9D1MQU8_9FIRM|nr:biotin transporter BioY [Candidatus Avacidaminococcus intestinavium]